LILNENKKDIRITAMKNWPSSKREELNESLIKQENLKEIFLYKYPEPGKSVYTEAGNKPKPTLEKITIKKLSERRAISICDYLNQFSQNYEFSFLPIGVGVKEGRSHIKIDPID
jgi:hypothetical protein